LRSTAVPGAAVDLLEDKLLLVSHTLKL